MIEIPPTAVNSMPPVGPVSVGTVLFRGFVTLVGWNISLGILLAVAAHDRAVPPAIAVLVLAGSNAIFAASIAVFTWRCGPLPEDSVESW